MALVEVPVAALVLGCLALGFFVGFMAGGLMTAAAYQRKDD